MTEMRVDPVQRLADAVPPAGEPVRMLPAEAYTSPAVLAWERRRLFAGPWTGLGREVDLFPAAVDGGRPTTQRAVTVGDVAALLVRDPARGNTLRMFANTCRHRGHELLAEGETSERRSVQCPYHAWTYDLAGQGLGAARGHGLVELPVREWAGWVFGHAASVTPDVSFEEHLGALAGIVEPYAPERLRLADRHTYEVAANWKVIAENYHECYHCPLIHPELCAVTPPTSGD